MRILSLVTLSLILTVSASSAAFAGEKSPYSKGFFDHLKGIGVENKRTEKSDYSRPNLKEGKIPHNNQWDNSGWAPSDWVAEDEDIRSVIDRFYASGLIVDQYEDKVPVLVVGKPFMQLSPVDQRHVVEFVDYAFKITDSQENGTFHIVMDGFEDDPLGLYSKHGLQFQ